MKGCIALVALLVAGAASAHDYYYYGYRFDYGYPYYSPRTDFELSQIRGELRQQRLRSNQRDREHGEQLDVLRQQLNTRYQVSAAQACYYRTTGGLELCADLFEADSPERERCELLVKERNPGC